MDQQSTELTETRQQDTDVTRTPETFSSAIQDEEDALNELIARRTNVIKTSWRAVRFGLDAKSAQIFYEKLFEEYPMTRQMFKDDMKVQYNKLFRAVTLAVDSLEDMDTLVPVLRKLGAAHAGYGVVREHYRAVTDCFLWMLNTYIVSQMPNNSAINWIFDIEDAWDWALTLIGNVMADAADEVLKERGNMLTAPRIFYSVEESSEDQTDHAQVNAAS